jgi:Zn-dependent protease/CBS domain-containing protein
MVAACAALLFFGCVLLHELAHSVVAMSYGLRVRSITLFLFGGVSNIEHEPSSARAEFLTAIVGPLTSIALGVLFLFAASVVTPISIADEEAGWAALARLGPLTTLLVWLGPINITIGLFNLIPGFPLDGGRVLRSILWSVTGNLTVATRWAAAAGQSIGWLLIAGGIAMSFGARVPFFGTGLGAGIWLAFIGWFLHSAALQYSTRLGLDEALAGMTVEQLMRRDGPVVAPELTVAQLVHEHFIPGDDRALPVAEESQLLGLVSIADIRRVPPDEWAVRSVGSIMRPVDALCVVEPDEPLAKAFERLARQDFEQLPVVAGGRLVGMLRRRDVARWFELAWKPFREGTSRSAGAPRSPGVQGPSRALR